MEAVRKNGHALQFASQTLRGDKEVVMEAVQQNGTALKYASKTLQVEKDVVTVAVRQKKTHPVTLHPKELYIGGFTWLLCGCCMLLPS